MLLMIPIDTPPQGRPRFTRTGRVYDPPKSRKFKEDFARLLLEDGFSRGEAIFTGPIKVDLRICRAGFDRKGATSRKFGDIDNLAKIILDAINDTGAIWQDDSQIVELRVTKAAVPFAHVEIIIEEVRDEQRKPLG